MGDESERLCSRLALKHVNGLGGSSALGAKSASRFAVLPKTKGVSRSKKRSIGDGVAAVALSLLCC